MFSKEFLREHFFSKVVIGGLAALVLLTVVYINFNRSNNSLSNSPTTEPVVTITNVPQIGAMSLGLTDQTRKTVGQSVTVTLTASSAGRLVTGYDLALQYDESAFQFLQATSLVTGYTSYAFRNEGHVAITGVKTLQGTSVAFSETPLVKLTFITKKAGMYSLELVPAIAKDKTQMVDATSSVLRPKLEGTSIAIY